MPQLRDLTAEEISALKAFAKANGRTWKSKLNELWMRAAASPVLHSLRNSHGPSWLHTYTLPKDEQ